MAKHMEVLMVEVEQALLSAIDRLAADGEEGEIRCLAALLTCRGKVEKRATGWQHPFQDYAERGGAAALRSLDGLIRRGIVVRTRSAVVLNSYIMGHNKDFVTIRCANRLFTRARRHFDGVLGEIRFADLQDICRLRSAAAINRALRNMGAGFRDVKSLGLVVSSARAAMRIFPTLRYMNEVPRVTGLALTLDQGGALTVQNLLNDVGVTYHLAVAAGCLKETDGSVQLTERGRELAAEYVAGTIRRRFGWISQCRPEAMHFLLDEFASPLPAIWVDGTPSKVAKAWPLQAEAPLRVLLKDRQLRIWMRRLVRRLTTLGLAQCIELKDGACWYYFAPHVATLAKDSFDLPEEPFALAPEFGLRLAAFSQLFGLRRETEGRWVVQPDRTIDEQLVRETLRSLREQELAAPRRDGSGSYLVRDVESYRWGLEEALLGPVMEFLGTLPEPAETLVGVTQTTTGDDSEEE
jgi:hypothetical protein